MKRQDTLNQIQIKDILSTLVDEKKYDLDHLSESLSSLLPEEVEKVVELGHDLSSENKYVALYLVQKSQHIIKKVGCEGLEIIAEVAREIAKDNSAIAINLIEKSPDILKRGTARDLIKTAILAKDIASQSISLAINLIEKSPEVIKRVGFKGLQIMAELALQEGGVSIVCDPDLNHREFIATKGLEPIYNYVLQ